MFHGGWDDATHQLGAAEDAACAAGLKTVRGAAKADHLEVCI
ncbi:hypothetical protein C4J95_0578 [Pseudomonas orientalis]|nr:hypothetical protein C4J96_0580 [Pseudomonas orientalis]AZE98068.1 hypothetical protein C4J95_0578 [Pseudomonas orientalis]